MSQRSPNGTSFTTNLASFIFKMSFAFLVLPFSLNLAIGQQTSATLSGFKAGNIMSDVVMSNKYTMTRAQIQSFLKSHATSCSSKGPYSNGSYYIDKLKKSSDGTKAYFVDSDGDKWIWSINNGHFVCMADEEFDGETAAHIIYVAARDYHINPQVLIVLLQKEQGLVTDAFPNNHQYLAATGYACPDDGNGCDNANAGFKTQIRKAAALFHEVLTGGWTNYPVGDNFIQYNPTDSCGGTVVDIKNRATSALYRYTPYQPNQAALNAGYGTGNSCSAYGNRNFYNYFTDWFGSTRYAFKSMQSPRYMSTKTDLYKTYPITDEPADSQLLPKGQDIYFTSVVTVNGTQYLRTKYDTDHNIPRAISRDSLNEKSFRSMQTPRYMRASEDLSKSNPVTDALNLQDIRQGQDVYFDESITVNGVLYLRSQWDTAHNIARALPRDKLVDLSFQPMQTPRFMTVENDLSKTYPITDKTDSTPLEAGRDLYFTSVVTINGTQYLRTEFDTDHDILRGIPRDSLSEMSFRPMKKPRHMAVKSDLYKTYPATGETDSQLLEQGQELYFASVMSINGTQYLRTEFDTDHDILRGIPRDSLSEVE